MIILLFLSTASIVKSTASFTFAVLGVKSTWKWSIHAANTELKENIVDANIDRIIFLLRFIFLIIDIKICLYIT